MYIHVQSKQVAMTWQCFCFGTACGAIIFAIPIAETILGRQNQPVFSLSFLVVCVLKESYLLMSSEIFFIYLIFYLGYNLCLSFSFKKCSVLIYFFKNCQKHWLEPDVSSFFVKALICAEFISKFSRTLNLTIVCISR